jgi:hypothetical protein
MLYNINVYLRETHTHAHTHTHTHTYIWKKQIGLKKYNLQCLGSLVYSKKIINYKLILKESRIFFK